jgi:hypothetical protein
LSDLVRFLKFIFRYFYFKIFEVKRANSLKLSFCTTSVYFNRRTAVWIIALASLLAYFPTFFNSFQLAWDDTWQLIENPLVHDYSLRAIYFHFTHFWQGQYSPFNSLFYLGINLTFGMNASAFHTACLIIHLINSALVFSISVSLISKFSPSLDALRIQAFAFVTALLFAIHPLQVESVAWISASKIVLYGLFALLAIWCYLRYLQDSKTHWIILTGLTYALGFASKEQAIILPLNLLLIDLAWGRFARKNWKSLLVSKVILEKIPFFLLTVGFLHFTWINTPGGIQQDVGYPFYQRIVFAFYSLVEYIFRFLAPAKLYFIHPFPMSPGEALPMYYWGYLPLAGIICYFVWDQYRSENSIALLGLLFFAINLALVLHIIPLPRPVITADRYMYLSVIGLAWILIGIGGQGMTSQTPKKQIAVFIGGLAWMVFLGIQTHRRTTEWKDSDSTKANVIELMEKKGATEEIEPLFNLIEHE